MTLIGQVDRDARVRLVLHEVHLARHHGRDRAAADRDRERPRGRREGPKLARAAKVEADKIIAAARDQARGIVDQANTRANGIVEQAKADGEAARKAQSKPRAPRSASRSIARAKSCAAKLRKLPSPAQRKCSAARSTRTRTATCSASWPQRSSDGGFEHRRPAVRESVVRCGERRAEAAASGRPRSVPRRPCWPMRTRGARSAIRRSTTGHGPRSSARSRARSRAASC